MRCRGKGGAATFWVLTSDDADEAILRELGHLDRLLLDLLRQLAGRRQDDGEGTVLRSLCINQCEVRYSNIVRCEVKLNHLCAGPAYEGWYVRVAQRDQSNGQVRVSLRSRVGRDRGVSPSGIPWLRAWAPTRAGP